MEGNNLSPGSMMQGAPFGNLDLHGNSMQTHAPNSEKQIFSNSQMPGTFTMTMNRAVEPDGFPVFQFKEHENSDKHHHHYNHHSKNGLSDDEEHDMTEDATDTPSGKGKKGSVWHRMKWTGSMVKLLITAVSYTGDDHSAEGGGRRNFTVMQKKGKWKAISRVMGERDCHVSPQQCEDKFNDLNKRYKRLTDILGRGTACDVVANPTLLDSMNHLSDKMKDDAKKILNSKHLFFEEMCSYHNNNRINLPEDHALQHSLLLALRSKEHDPRDLDDDQSEDSDYEQNDEEQRPVHTNTRDPSMQKRARHGDAALVTSSSHEVSERSDPHGITVDINKAFPDGTNLALLKQELALQKVENQKRLMQFEEKDLELKRQRIKWERFRKNKDREIEKMALENEYMMIENKRMELELKQKELELELRLKGQVNLA